MGGQPKPRDPARDYAAGIKVYLDNLPRLLDAEDTARDARDPERIQHSIDLEHQFDPNRTAIRDSLSQNVLDDLNAPGLPPAMVREIEQGIRGAQTARGNAYGNAAISAEALGRGKLEYDVRNRSLANAGTLLSTPSVATPDRTPAYTAGGGTAGAMGLNFGQQQFANQASQPNQWATALGGAASGAAAGASFGPYGALIGGVAGGAIGYFSDRRLKHNIVQVGTSPKGYGRYEFSYRDMDGRFRGAMSDDVAA